MFYRKRAYMKQREQAKSCREIFKGDKNNFLFIHMNEVDVQVPSLAISIKFFYFLFLNNISTMQVSCCSCVSKQAYKPPTLPFDYKTKYFNFGHTEFGNQKQKKAAQN